MTVKEGVYAGPEPRTLRSLRGFITAFSILAVAAAGFVVMFAAIGETIAGWF